MTEVQRFERYPDMAKYPGWQEEIRRDPHGQYERVVIKLRALSMTPVSLFCGTVNGVPCHPRIISVHDHVIKGGGWIVRQRPGKKVEKIWQDEDRGQEIRFFPGTYVAYLASSAGLSAKRYRSPLGLDEEYFSIDDPRVPEDFRRAYKRLLGLSGY